MEGDVKYGDAQYKWLGEALSLISKWDQTRANKFQTVTKAMIGNLQRQMCYGIVLTTIREAIASLESTLPQDAGQVFGPGAVYDFFKDLNKILGKATRTVFIVDPYMDDAIFDRYLSGNISSSIAVQLLVSEHAKVKEAAAAFSTQHNVKISIRQSKTIHDRVIFIDSKQCWVFGTSIKDAAVKNPTYLDPISADIVPKTLKIYEELWEKAEPII
ncbi:hypothetical conserved protein [Candidatus Nitrosoglobus terrae]|uniref:Hypothetical conserved protein n=1 Tax=Candidatus Nitrosoglobus terrae TaxID=1630141 RepID=A0A1Q2SL57_9GAMM|nr:hypothetical conserved protein [Candidatus Nitrosoglobus terrae]